MLTRRHFFLTASAAGLHAREASLSSKERVERAVAGKDVDRHPYTCWYHFLDDKQPGSFHAEKTLAFHRKFHTDFVKVMSDYAYPKPAGEWWKPRVEANPFPEQIKALELIREGIGGKAHFVETIFNPWNVAEKLSSKDEVKRLMKEKPQALLDAIEVIAKSEANHARKAIQAGASGIFLAIANADESVMDQGAYSRFSEPFDRMILEAVKTAPLNTLHIHGDKVYLDRFLKGWHATVLNYSAHGTGVKPAAVRAKYSGVLMAGIDERAFRSLNRSQLKAQLAEAAATGKKFIAAPGCSVPNDSKDDEIVRFGTIVGALAG